MSDGKVRIFAPPLDFGGPIERPFQPLDKSWLERPAFACFDEMARLHPEGLALDDGERRFTYAQAHVRVLALAGRIAAHVPRGEAVGIGLPHNATNPLAALAALAAGAPYVPIDLDAPDIRNRLIIEDSGLRAVVVDGQTRDFFARLAPDLPQIDIDDGSAGTPLPAGAWETVGADDPALITYTSGSTGQPKGIALSNRFLVNSARVQINALHVTPEDRIAQLFSPTVARATQDIYGALFSGAALRIIDLKHAGLQEISRAARAGELTIIDTVPHVFRRLLSIGAEPETFRFVRILAIGGDRLFATDVDLFRRYFPADGFLYYHLGSSESDRYAHRFIGHDARLDSTVVPAGWPLPERPLSLIGADGEEVELGETGDIVITASTMALGYWRRPDLTEAAFSAVPGSPGLVRFKVGDLGRFRPDGQLEYHGRRDRMVKVHGNRVELEEVEAAIRKHPPVLDAAVIARRVDDDAAVIAYVVARQGSLDIEGLKTWLADRLPAHMRPVEVHVLSELPTLPSLKTDFMKLEALDRESAGTAAEPDMAAAPAGQLPRDAGLAEVARGVWTRLLSAESWSEDTAWQDAGGTSLKALELVMHLEVLLRRRVPVDVLLPHTRPSELIANLENASRPAAAAPRPAGDRPLVFFLPGAAGPTMDQAALVRDLADICDIRLLDYPSIDQEAPRIISIDETLAKLEAEIAALQPKGPLWLMGYSYGGYLAVELGARAVNAGRPVPFLGLIDSPPLPRSMANGPAFDPDQNLRAQLVESSHAKRAFKFALVGIGWLYMALAYRLVRRGWLGPFTWLAGRLEKLGYSRARLFFWWHVGHMSRRASVQDHLPGYFPGRIRLFRSRDEVMARFPEDYCWRNHSQDVTIEWIDGVHEMVFTPENVGRLRDVLREALSQTVREQAGQDADRIGREVALAGSSAAA